MAVGAKFGNTLRQVKLQFHFPVARLVSYVTGVASAVQGKMPAPLLRNVQPLGVAVQAEIAALLPGFGLL